MRTSSFRLAFCAWAVSGLAAGAQIPGLYSASCQVNVDAAGHNIVGDAANEPTLCIDPTNPNRMAIGWRQFDSVTSDFRQAGWAWSTNGGLTWTFPGVLDAGVFRSDPVLAADAEGTFYYLGVLTNSNYHCDLFRSTNGGMSWQSLGQALGGDKPWLVSDTTSGPGRGNLYQAWSPWYNYANDVNAIFSRSTDGGQSWLTARSIPRLPYWGTLAVGPAGEVYMFGWDGSVFWVNRSTDAWNRAVTPTFDLTTQVNLGGGLIYGDAAVNPVGLLGQPWIAVDRSSGPTRGNLYVLCTVSGTGNPANVMFARSTDGGQTWSAPRRLNDDSPTANAYHWFGTLSVAPNGRIDACWNDTRSDPSQTRSQLYYACSQDAGLTWSTNCALTSPFNHTLGYPVQQKMGDYLGMVSLDAAACIAYAATLNGEEDIYFACVELPLTLHLALSGSTVQLSWSSAPGRTYCVQVKDSLLTPWSAATNLGCLTGTGGILTMEDSLNAGAAQRFYRIVGPR
jgi:hypothetical protein